MNCSIRFCTIVLALGLGAAWTATTQAAPLELDVALNGISHNFTPALSGGNNEISDPAGATSSSSFNQDLATFDAVNLTAVLPTDKRFVVNPASGFDNELIYIFTWSAPNTPGGGNDLSALFSFIDASGTPPTTATQPFFLRSDGDGFTFRGNIPISAPFEFRGIRLSINGPFNTDNIDEAFTSGQLSFRFRATDDSFSAVPDPGRIATIQDVPEPNSLVLLGLGGLTLLTGRRR